MRRALLAVLLLPVASGCYLIDVATVGVEHVERSEVDQQLDQSALSGPNLSSSTLEALHYFNLDELLEQDSDELLIELHRAVAADPSRRFLHALSEIAYLRARELGSRAHYLAAAAYAYLYLIGEPELPAANPYDRRFRWSCDLYNRGLREAFMVDHEIEPTGGRHELPIGSLEISLDRSKFPIDDPGLRLLPADDYSVWGLSIRVRDSGLGVPLIAHRTGTRKDDPLAAYRNAAVHVPSTLFLRLEGGLSDLEHGITARLELHSSFEPEVIVAGDRKVPLESDFSATLAWALDRSELWGFSSRGFFSGDETRNENRLFMVRPYEPGLVPVVFVHGTASNPANWAEMFNLLQGDPRIRDHMQFWFFQYSSGTLIAFSAARLRAALNELVKTLDPEGKDPALRRIVVVGHSQGGLLTKLMAVDSDMSWWDDLVGTPFEEFDFPPEQEQLVRSALDFDPVPGVQRVVYISTPHGGSFLADRLFARLIAKMIALPGEVTSLGESLQRSGKKLPPVLRQGIPTSLDNMRASNPFLQRLARAPLAPGVKSHSIIAIGRADPAHPEKSSDGVVKYTSSHVEGVESEYLAPGGHSCQSNPRVISELRRILLLHLQGN